jgi:EF hand domain-containing protein
LSMTKTISALIAALLPLQVGVASAYEFNKQTNVVADAGVRRLLRLMDKDKNGTVSRREFMRFLTQRFDLLDRNGNRSLEPEEMQAMKIPTWVVRWPSLTKAER